MDLQFLFVIDSPLSHELIMLAMLDQLPGAQRERGCVVVGGNVIRVDERWESTPNDFMYFDGMTERFRFECTVFPIVDSVTLQMQVELVGALRSIFGANDTNTQVICDTELAEALGL